MPEMKIGYFPYVASSFFSSWMDRETGKQISGEDAL
jgi:hypothetical protein